MAGNIGAQRLLDPSDQAIATQLVADLQRDFHLTLQQAQGFVGNLAMESQGFTRMQEVRPTGAAGKGGWGYAQWTADRRDAFDKHVADNNLDRSSYEANYGFINKELNTRRYKDRVLTPLGWKFDPEMAADVVTQGYEGPSKPNIPSRHEWTQAVMNITGPGPGGVDNFAANKSSTDTGTPQAIVDAMHGLEPAGQEATALSRDVFGPQIDFNLAFNPVSPTTNNPRVDAVYSPWMGAMLPTEAYDGSPVAPSLLQLNPYDFTPGPLPASAAALSLTQPQLDQSILDWVGAPFAKPRQFNRPSGLARRPGTLPGADTALNAINAIAPGPAGAGLNPALGYAGGGPSQGWNPGFPPAQLSPPTVGSYANPAAGPQYANPAVGSNYGAPAGGYGRNYLPGADLSSIGWGGPQAVLAGPGNPAPLSDFERQMAQVPSMVIPKYIPVTHHVPNPAYVAQFGPVEPPMPDFMGMLAARLSPDRGTSVDPTLANQAAGLGASPLGQMSDYLLDKIPPPLPSFASPPLPTIQDPEAIRAILVPALQAVARQRALAAQGQGAPWEDSNDLGGSLSSTG